MSEPFFKLSQEDRREALAVAAAASGRPIHLLDKDVWLVWVLDVLFRARFGEHLVFKGGSSLSKGYALINRFSEDIDLTYDIRMLAPDLAGNAPGALPPTKSQEKRWTKEIRNRLPVWIRQEVLPILGAALTESELPASVSTESEKLLLEYTPMAAGTGYVRPVVVLEFGARSTGEPCESRMLVCDAAASVASVAFPVARARVLRPERTFWEKATAVHVFCQQGEYRGGERFARHWHDLARLDRAGFAGSAIVDHALALAVAKHKAMFFPEKTSEGKYIDYVAAVSGGLQLVPRDRTLDSLSQDYDRMVQDGLLFDKAESFDDLMEQCRDLESPPRAGCGCRLRPSPAGHRAC
jgi:hypothetical protein